MLKEFDLVCVNESELMQWQARGWFHLATSRILRSGTNKSTLFSLAPFGKLDDAKAKVIVRLSTNFCGDSYVHPNYGDPNVLSLPWEGIQSICPALPQFKRRLDSFNLKIEDWDITALWEEWLVTQGCYERRQAMQSVLAKIGFNDNNFIKNSRVIDTIVINVVRPQSDMARSVDIPIGWRGIIQKRDEILKRLRFEGHSDRTSFLEASILEILKLNGCKANDYQLSELITERDFGWTYQDLGSSVLNLINNTGGAKPLSMTDQISPIFGAAYLRLYDELFYGRKNWFLCFNILRFLKYSVETVETDYLTAAILASFSSEDLRSLDLPARFHKFDDEEP